MLVIIGLRTLSTVRLLRIGMADRNKGEGECQTSMNGLKPKYHACVGTLGH